MGEPSSLWARFRRARVLQVLAVYLGASWLVVQISHTLVDALALPAWVTPVAIILLLVGLVVTLATAWVQSRPETTAREAAGQVPTDWQVALRDIAASLRAGRMPHPTWGRAITGGLVVLALLFGGAGAYVGLTRGFPRPGPAPRAASQVADGIAVMPFEVRGQDLEIWREGMMDLLTSGLDGVGGFRTIDSRTVMARWQVQGAGPVDLDATLNIARATGARFALVGSVVGLGPDVRLVAHVHDLDTGREVAAGRAQGPAGDVLRLVDELAVATMRNMLLAIGQDPPGDRSAETITTSSLPALRAYLEGEAHFRRGRFAEAVQSYERAVAEDTTFAIALVRLSDAYGWLEDMSSRRILEVGERAMAQAHRLSPRHQFFMQGWDALNRGTADGVASLREAVRKYPDDPGAWFLLAETYIHVGGATYATDDDIRHALQRATSLDPNFAPYFPHVAEYAVLAGDRAAAERALQRIEELTADDSDLHHFRLAIPLLLGDSAEAAEALRGATSLSPRALRVYGGAFGLKHDRLDRDAQVDAVLARVTNTDRTAFQAYYAGAMGQVQRGIDLAAGPRVEPAARAVFWALIHELWDARPPDDVLTVEACDTPAFDPVCFLAAGIATARLGGRGEHDRFVDRLRSAAAAAADPVRAERLMGHADVIEGAAAWRAGDPGRGRDLLLPQARIVGPAGERARLELGWLEAETGRPAEALRHFRAALRSFTRASALYGAARMHEELGEPEGARGYWASLVTLTAQGDDLPRIREARQALARAVPDPR
jgi:tetratricopeptide (TPR) repeat protein